MADQDRPDWSWLTVPASALMICLGMGSCGYLWSAGDARFAEGRAAEIAARAAATAAEKCAKVCHRRTP